VNVNSTLQTQQLVAAESGIQTITFFFSAALGAGEGSGTEPVLDGTTTVSLVTGAPSLLGTITCIELLFATTGAAVVFAGTTASEEAGLAQTEAGLVLALLVLMQALGAMVLAIWQKKKRVRTETQKDKLTLTTTFSSGARIVNGTWVDKFLAKMESTTSSTLKE